MKLQYEYPVMIFKRDYEGRTYYSLGLSKKNQDGSYLNGYMPCQFKKEVTVDDKKKIYIKDAWLTFYIKDKKTMPYVFINQFEYVEDVIKETKEETKEETKKESEPITFYASDVILTDEDLPF